MKRRSLLAASGTALVALSAGCSDIVSSDEQETYSFGVYNGSRVAYEFKIRVGNERETWFHEETLELDAEMANEEIPIDDVPVSFTLEIDAVAEEEQEFP
ncbi:hypothetical protein [Natrialba taiwanensis]|uniref:Uncharacterized protein n=1 Tax=Natrialba taiwanensis DSM 12281 TaxID=1230458 RepID=M0AAS6_9EURY|nr:hypothetical protein [Natrialba taiwanensis]ELY95860.1 hypothetical protein C484_02664 [Natrialba taiwanensis DSM 12281]